MGERLLTADDLAAAARRAAVNLASDERVRCYDQAIVGLILERLVVNLAGAGDLENVARLMDSDPKLEGVPFNVLHAVLPVAFTAFAFALAEAPSSSSQEETQQ